MRCDGVRRGAVRCEMNDKQVIKLTGLKSANNVLGVVYLSSVGYAPIPISISG